MNDLNNIKNIKFSGHDTFPLRLTWLPKAVIGIHDNPGLLVDYKKVMTDLGVGKNMAKAIRHWVDSSQLVDFNFKERTHHLNSIGQILFSKEGDPFFQKQDTIWLLHYLICSNNNKNALWIYLFNYHTTDVVDYDNFMDGVKHWCNDNNIPLPSDSTIHRDYLCCMNMYNSSLYHAKYKSDIETFLMNPFKELRLINRSTNKGQYNLRKISFQEISTSLFIYTLTKYIDELNYPTTINIEELLYNPFSPARIFRLSESVLADYLQTFQKSTKESYIYDSTAGVAQLLRNKDSKYNLLRRFKSIYR